MSLRVTTWPRVLATKERITESVISPPANSMLFKLLFLHNKQSISQLTDLLKYINKSLSFKSLRVNTKVGVDVWRMRDTQTYFPIKH